MIDKKYIARFWKKVSIKENKEECWEWIGAKYKDGYGKMRIDGILRPAHRIVYELAKAAPGKLNVCHKCDNIICCNPDHLFLGTQKDNIEDCIKKGRFKSNKGSKNPNASLTELEVACIKDMLKRGIKTKEIYKAYPIANYNHVYNIKHNKSWTHVK